MHASKLASMALSPCELALVSLLWILYFEPGRAEHPARFATRRAQGVEHAAGETAEGKSGHVVVSRREASSLNTDFETWTFARVASQRRHMKSFRRGTNDFRGLTAICRPQAGEN